MNFHLYFCIIDFSYSILCIDEFRHSLMDFGSTISICYWIFHKKICESLPSKIGISHMDFFYFSIPACPQSMDYISIGHIWIDLIQCHELFLLFIDYILLKIPIKFEYSSVLFFSPEWRHFIWIFVESVFVLVGLNKLNSMHSNRFSAPPKSTSNLFLTIKSLEHDNWFCYCIFNMDFLLIKRMHLHST